MRPIAPGRILLGAFLVAALFRGFAAADEPPDVRVDVGGRVLRARVAGSGGPVVVFESGGGGATLDDWGPVPAVVAKQARVVLYDRAGIGGSGPSPSARTGEQVARDLHALLRQLGARPPFVLVGHSLGGAFVRFFGAIRPEEVAGFVFLDPTTEEMRPKLESEGDRRRFEASLASLPPGPRAEMEALPALLEALARLPAPPDRPAVVVTAAAVPGSSAAEREALAASGLDPAKLRAARERAREMHARLAARFPRGRQVLASRSGHAVHLDEPDLVAGEILRVVAEARERR